MAPHTETVDTVPDVSSPRLFGLALVGSLATVAMYWVLVS